MSASCRLYARKPRAGSILGEYRLRVPKAGFGIVAFTDPAVRFVLVGSLPCCSAASRSSALDAVTRLVAGLVAAGAAAAAAGARLSLVRRDGCR
jgi:hypothetical protein